MVETVVESTLAKVIAGGSFLITVFIWMSGLTDPVNATKLAFLGASGLASLFILSFFYANQLLTQLRIYSAVYLLFIFTSAIAVFKSSSPLSQNIFGVFGRNTGFLSYFLLSVLFLAAITLKQRANFRLIAFSFLAAGTVNVLYSAWVLSFGDPVKWDNPYGRILGTFGNPNFVSSFLGMILAALVAISLDSNLNMKVRMLSMSIGALTLFEIYKSNSIQGFVVAATGCIVSFFIYFRSRKLAWWLVSIFSVGTLILICLTIAGILQKGPFSFLYKKSVSLRGTYWETAWDMGQSKPFFGVGMDSYIDSYRMFRPERALVDTPGVNITSNAAHNIFLDFFAYGGFPLLVAYSLVVLSGLIAIISHVRKLQSFDWIFASMTAAWVGYQVQSIISINQIGLAVWGWVLTGALIGYTRMGAGGMQRTVNSNAKKPIKKGSSQTLILSPQLVGGVGLMCGLLVASPPLAADSKWYSALVSKNFSYFEKSLTPSMYNPQNSFKYGQAINLLQNSQLFDQSYFYAKQAVEFNPMYFEAWKQLYYQPRATEKEKAEALKRMKKLDPLNPDVLSNK